MPAKKEKEIILDADVIETKKKNGKKIGTIITLLFILQMYLML